MKLVLTRLVYEDKQTLGHLQVYDGLKPVFSCRTLELAWRNNMRGVSCIPVGCYPINFEYSPSFKMNLWELKNVPDRSQILIHSGNFYGQIRGCILVGDMHTDINGDGYRDVRNSVKTLEKLHTFLYGSPELTIIEV